MSVLAYVDGASRSQGVTPGVHGHGAIGVVIYKNNQLFGRYARGLGRATNNEAEYEAVLAALMLCWSNPELLDPIIYSDSQLVVKTVNKEWQCWNVNLRPLLMSIQEIQSVFRARVIWVPRVEVHEADKLARDFLDNLETRLALDDEERKQYYRAKKNHSNPKE